ncbi:MAG TPA: hypothetical protein VMZ03_05420 [Chitinophagaceae bacterium]|nr:hypothetical protein [Chitinophagaceae bacterium]
MEVHHHTKSIGSHPAKKKWAHYFWEFFMLFLAVTLGFFVENWREHGIEHKRAREYANMLKLDLMNDTLSLDHLINVLKEESANRDLVITLLNKNKNDITLADLRKKDTLTFLIDYFQPNNATLEQMKSSGGLRYFQNITLVGSLAYYDWSIKHYFEMRRDLENIYGDKSSEHFLQFDIHMEEFLSETADMDSTLSALKAGYNFDSWLEVKKITEVQTFFKTFLKEGIYPDLKRQAKAIIDILNKEYHFK